MWKRLLVNVTLPCIVLVSANLAEIENVVAAPAFHGALAALCKLCLQATPGSLLNAAQREATGKVGNIRRTFFCM
jgi:hypothetical protein